MDLVLKPVGPEDYALMERYKRATTVAVMGDDSWFGVWFPPTRSYAMFLEECRGFDPASCVLAEVNGKAVGALHLKVRDGVGLLNNIYIEPEWRGRRIGEAMDAYAMQFFAKHGCGKALLWTSPQATKVVAFYERMGWRLTGETKPEFVQFGKTL